MAPPIFRSTNYMILYVYQKNPVKNVFSLQLRNKLSAAQIDPFELSIVSQSDCPKNQTAGYNININDDTISAHAAAEVIRKAGDKIGDGVEYISGKAKDVYNKVSKDSEESGKAEKQKVNPDAEWLP